MPESKPQILLTNDDGIESPGLWAAAEALSEIGYVWVAAPRDQSSGTGRSMPSSSDGRITVKQMTVHGQEWTVHAVGGTPAQTVQHAIVEIIGQTPDLVVSGINYGLNVGFGITISGTVGATMEGAAYGAAALAVSLETDVQHHFSHSSEIDFSTSAYFTAYFARHLLDPGLGLASRFIKVDLPSDATPETPWKLTRLSPDRFYYLKPSERKTWDEPNTLGYDMRTDYETFNPQSDVYAVMQERVISVTPLTLDMTANISFEEMDREMRGKG